MKLGLGSNMRGGASLSRTAASTVAKIGSIAIWRRSNPFGVTKLPSTTSRGGFVHDSNESTSTRLDEVILTLKALSQKAMTVLKPVIWADTIGHFSWEKRKAPSTWPTGAVGSCDVFGSG